MTGKSAFNAFVGAWFSTTPITLARTELAPSGALISNASAFLAGPICTVLRACRGQSRWGHSTSQIPIRATVWPRAITCSIGRVLRSEVRITSARRPGAIEPRSRSNPKCVAVLIVAICKAIKGSHPHSIAWRTTRFIWPSFTIVPEWLSSVHRINPRGSRPFSVTAVIWLSTSYQAEPSRIMWRIPWRVRAIASASHVPS